MYIKLSLEEANNFNLIITEEIARLPLSLEIGTDIRKYLIYKIIGDFSYVKIGLYDLKNHNRINEASQEEIEMWDNIISSNNWETVESLPTINLI